MSSAAAGAIRRSFYFPKWLRTTSVWYNCPEVWGKNNESGHIDSGLISIAVSYDN